MNFLKPIVVSADSSNRRSMRRLDRYVPLKKEVLVALVHIDNLAPGMVLARKVCDRSGRMLLPEGAELTERHFSVLRMWGVLEAEIVSDGSAEEQDAALPADLDPALVATARDEVAHLFVHNNKEHPAIKELMRICVERRASRA